MSEPARRRITVLYNTDYDDELIAATDESAVRVSAQAVQHALTSAGFASELSGLHGRDLDRHIRTLCDDPPALIFNLCESLCGETQNELLVAALLDFVALPYTGSDALTLGMCLHKHRTKEVLVAHGIATPEYWLLRSPADLERGQVLDSLPYPCFLKLAREDASVGISRDNWIPSREALVRRAAALFGRYRQPILCERYIHGREVNVSLLGNAPEVTILPLHEIDYSAMPPACPHIITYAGKWDPSHEEFRGSMPVLMTELAPDLRRTIEDTARATYLALGLRDYGRIDMRIDQSGTAWVIDVNPNCDLAPDAGLARSAAAAGISYPALIHRICEEAAGRHEASRD